MNDLKHWAEWLAVLCSNST